MDSVINSANIYALLTVHSKLASGEPSQLTGITATDTACDTQQGTTSAVAGRAGVAKALCCSGDTDHNASHSPSSMLPQVTCI